MKEAREDISTIRVKEKIMSDKYGTENVQRALCLRDNVAYIKKAV